MALEKQTLFEDMQVKINLLPAYDVTDDPRPDLGADSAAWRKLLKTAHWKCGADGPESLFWHLHGLRCTGCQLERDGRGWRITAGQNQNYAADRERYLVPRQQAIIELLEYLNALS